MRIDDLSAPVMVTWQMTRGCDLACLHCCTDSAPGKELPGELSKILYPMNFEWSAANYGRIVKEWETLFLR